MKIGIDIDNRISNIDDVNKGTDFLFTNKILESYNKAGGIFYGKNYRF